jgi:polyferredoxin
MVPFNCSAKVPTSAPILQFCPEAMLAVFVAVPSDTPFLYKTILPEAFLVTAMMRVAAAIGLPTKYGEAELR